MGEAHCGSSYARATQRFATRVGHARRATCLEALPRRRGRWWARGRVSAPYVVDARRRVSGETRAPGPPAAEERRHRSGAMRPGRARRAKASGLAARPSGARGSARKALQPEGPKRVRRRRARAAARASMQNCAALPRARRRLLLAGEVSRSRRRCCAASEEALFRPEGASTRVARAHRGVCGLWRARRVRRSPGHNSTTGSAGICVDEPSELAPRRARAADYALIDGRRRRGPGRFHADWGHARRASAPSSYPKCHRDWRDTHDTEEGSGIDAAERAGRCLCCLGGVRGRVLSRKCWSSRTSTADGAYQPVLGGQSR